MIRWLKSMARRFLPAPMVTRIRKWRTVRDLREVHWDEEPDLKIVSELVKPGDTAIDVGANFGMYTRALSQLVGPGGRVLSLEPIPATYDVLVHVVRRLGLTNVSTHEVAASDHEHEVSMEVPKYGDGGDNPHEARIITEVAGAPGHFRLHAQTLDRVVGTQASVTFVKVDVEGHEWPCLKGASELLRRCQPALLIECSSDPDDAGSDAQHLFAWLSEQGYSAFWFDGQSLRKRQRGDSSVNYFFLDSSHMTRLSRVLKA